MITASPDDQTEVSLTTSLQPTAQLGANYSEQSMSVFTVTVYSFTRQVAPPGVGLAAKLKQFLTCDLITLTFDLATSE